MPGKTRRGFRAVYDRHFEQVYGYIAYRLAPDLNTAADVTQEVFLAAVRAWDSYRGTGSRLTWLRAIARRKVVDHYRARGRRGREVPLEASLLEARGDDAPPAERAAMVSLVMRSLPGHQAELLEDKYLEGLSVRQMAGGRKMTEGAVTAALFRARQAFREAWQRCQNTQEISG